MNTIFETSRLVLRQFTINDAPLLLQLNSDPEVLKYLHEPLVTSLEHASQVLNDIILPQYELKLGRWAAFTKVNQEFIGWCGLKFRPELDEIDLGYRFMKKVWGQGFATESAKQTLVYGFDSLQLTAITGRAHIDNLASLRVLEKIGMSFIGEGVVDDCPVRTYQATSASYSP